MNKATPQISIDQELLDRFDAHIAELGTTDRSKMIAHLIRRFLAGDGATKPKATEPGRLS